MMRDWLEGLNARERLILGAGGALALLMLLYLLLWRPLAIQHERLQQRVESQQALAAWMQGAAERIGTLRDRLPAPTAGDTSPREVVTRALSDLQLSSRHLPGGQGDEHRLTMDDAEFERVVHLLIRLQQAGIVPIGVNLRRAQDPGRVEARLRFAGSIAATSGSQTD